MSTNSNGACRGCIPMMLETVALVSLFFIAVISTVYPLLGH